MIENLHLIDHELSSHEKEVLNAIVVRHFKRETLIESGEYDDFKYLYKINSIALSADTGKPVIIYEPLDNEKGYHKRWVRDYEEFMSEVDHEKYPNIKQKYRFENIENYS